MTTLIKALTLIQKFEEPTFMSFLHVDKFALAQYLFKLLQICYK